MNLLITLILFCGLAFFFAYQHKLHREQEERLLPTRIEYRYLPLSIDQWFKESQYTASDVMNSLIEDTNGYCLNDSLSGMQFTGMGEEDTTIDEDKTTAPPTFAENTAPATSSDDIEVSFV